MFLGHGYHDPLQLMRKLLVLALLAFPLAAQSRLTLLGAGAPAAAASGYLHYYVLTTAASGSTNLSSFPTCGSTTTAAGCSLGTDISANLATAAHGGYVQNTVTQSGGSGGTEPADAVFGTTSTCSTLIPWETESYSATTGAWVFHFNNGTYNSAGGQFIYLCFDQASVTTQQNTGSYAPSAVWDSSFLAVVHLGNGTTLSGVDSTGANSFTNNGASAGSGRIDGAAVLASGNDLHVTSPNSALQTTSDITLSAWIYPTTLAAERGIVVDWDGSARKFLFELNGSDIRFAAQGAGIGVLDTATSVYVNNWYYVVAVCHSGAMTVLINSILDINTANASSGIVSSTDPVYIGNSTSNSRPFIGTIDESRISNAVRSADWITAEYNNQKASSTFLAVGTLH
jgi:hypothetical protein